MTSEKMSIAQGLVAARRRDQDAELERSVLDASQRRQKASGGGRGGGRGRSGSPDARAAASPRLAASAGLPPEELLASVRDAIVQSGRRPWWEDADATVDAPPRAGGAARVTFGCPKVAGALPATASDPIDLDSD